MWPVALAYGHIQKNLIGRYTMKYFNKLGKRLQKMTRKDVFRLLKKSFIIGIIVVPLLALLLYLTVLGGGFGRMPSAKDLKDIKNYEASEVYAADGVMLGKYYIENRTNAERDKIAKVVLDALVATEDARFYQHNGIDKRSLARVLVKSLLLQDRSAGGGSTITQQLAKNIYPRQNYWLLTMPVNKIKEAIIATRLEEVYSKEDIITMYLNTVPFGGNVFGIEAASRRFFNVSSADLKAEQAAVLIGMLKATTYYNPRLYPDRAKGRRDVVLGQMEKYKYLSATATDSIQNIPLALDYSYVTHNEGIAPYFRERLRLQVNSWLKAHPKPDGTTYNVYTDGLKIYTSIDSHLQEYAEKAVKVHMKQLQQVFDKHVKGKNPVAEDDAGIQQAVRRSKRYRSLVQAGKTEEEIKTIFHTPVPMSLYSWEGEVEKTISPLDSVIYYQLFLNAGFMAMEPRTGLVRAWVGGIDHEHFQYDHVVSKRQVGSTFKPIVYATALEQGVDPCEYISNEQVMYTEYDNWAPKNSDNKYEGRYSMQGGLTHSINTVAVKVIMQAGIDKVVDFAGKLGIGDVPEEPSIALGTPDLSLMEMVAAYGAFANRGYYVAPVYLMGIKDNKGNVIADFTKEQDVKKVMERETADMMIQMMKSVVDSGSASRLRYAYHLPNDIAGKTGTTQSQSDGWFIGMIPDLVAGSWVGADNRLVRFRSLSLGQGANTALPIWATFMGYINADTKYAKIRTKQFPEPSSRVLRKLDCPMFEQEKEPGFLERLFTKEEEKEQDKPGEIKKYDPKKEGRKKKKFFDAIKDIFSNN